MKEQKAEREKRVQEAGGGGRVVMKESSGSCRRREARDERKCREQKEVEG